MNLILICLIIFVASYVIGSFPTGYLVVKIFKNEDIRTIGSGSTGATNVKRVLGKRGFFGVLLVDAIKGFIPVFIAEYLEKKLGLPEYATIGILPIIASVAVIIGHSKSIFLKFTGGKSVATCAGVCLALDWRVALICYLYFAVVSYVSKYISLASTTVMVLMVVLMWFFGKPVPYLIFCSFVAIYVIYLHRENIKRLLNGTENKVR
ncbi:MAG: glycerol-3-phosphate 1-O-acyltransferase PlsY [Candidatus Gastranaerophilales bacterium]|nr:glycerol-3-phosphate 1-O-acyltransferase PlsY [Candidatus Gastranaerophilales bacterium]